MRLILLFLLFSSICYAGQPDLDKEKERIKSQGKIPLTTKEENDLLTRGWRNRRLDEFDPPVSKTSRPSDYINEIHRGIIEHSPQWKNYSFHKIQVSSGTIIKNNNFSQISPNTDAFDRTPGIFGHNLTFIDCNLTNVKTYPDWTLINSNNAQVDMIGLILEDGSVDIVDTIYIAQFSKDVPIDRIKPIGVLE